jgi:SAM-dependent methyltransferase
MREVIWHDVECGSYDADLPLWEELAARGGRVLELGCGSGRVALHLARLGHEIVGLDSEAPLVDAVNSRARADALPARAAVANATSFELRARFRLVLAPMQLVQILGGERRRRAMLARVAAHLEPGGLFAVSLVDPRGLLDTASGAVENGGGAPLPDVRELDGWIFSSLPLAVRDDGGAITVERLRQAVSPAGELSEEVDITELGPLPCSRLEAEAADAGLRPAGRRTIAATDAHVGSAVCLLERR